MGRQQEVVAAPLGLQGQLDPQLQLRAASIRVLGHHLIQVVALHARQVLWEIAWRTSTFQTPPRR